VPLLSTVSIAPKRIQEREARQVAVRFAVTAPLGIDFVKSDHSVFKVAISTFPRGPKGVVGAAEKYNRLQKKEMGKSIRNDLEVGMVLTQISDASLAHCPYAKVMTFINQRRSSLLFPKYIKHGGGTPSGTSSGPFSGAGADGANDSGHVLEKSVEQPQHEEESHLVLVFAHPHMQSLLLQPKPPPTPPRVRLVTATAATAASSGDEDCDDSFLGDECRGTEQVTRGVGSAIVVAMMWEDAAATIPTQQVAATGSSDSAEQGEGQDNTVGQGQDRSERWQPDSGSHTAGEVAAVAGGEGGTDREGGGSCNDDGDGNRSTDTVRGALRGAVEATVGAPAIGTIQTAIPGRAIHGLQEEEVLGPRTSGGTVNAGTGPMRLQVSTISTAATTGRTKKGWCGALQGNLAARQELAEDGCTIV
jgi:hypothetical protein